MDIILAIPDRLVIVDLFSQNDNLFMRIKYVYYSYGGSLNGFCLYWTTGSPCVHIFGSNQSIDQSLNQCLKLDNGCIIVCTFLLHLPINQSNQSTNQSINA